MKINWRVRIANKEFWKALIPAVIVFIHALLGVFGVEINLGDIGNKLLALVEAVFLVLGIIGIINDPTTDGLRDSERALGYHEPYKEVIEDE